MTPGLVPVWVALLGADRFDLLGGHGPVVLHPFLVITPLLVVRVLGRPRLGHGTPRLRAYTAHLAVLLALASLSVLRSPDVSTSVGRLALLAALMCGSTLVVAGHAGTDWERQLKAGGRLGLAVSVVTAAAQIGSFLGLFPDHLAVGPASLHLAPASYAGVVPRLSGLTEDPNRAGLVILTHWALARGGHVGLRSRWDAIASLLVLGTLSRSALLGGLALLLLSPPVVARAPQRSPRLVGAVVTLLLALMALALPEGRETLGRSAAPLTERLSVAEGSAPTHLALIGQGIREGTRDIPRVALGIGYGTSYRILGDRFGGDRYGNFHSLPITLWVESGLGAALLMLALFWGPLRRSQRWRPLLGGMAVFNVFYQSITEPAMWVALALGWLHPERPCDEST